MSDPENDKPADGGLELDWDDALADLERELDEERVVAASPPMPQKPAAAAARPGTRPLYKPPTADEIQRFRGRDARETAPPPKASGPTLGSVGFEDEDEDEGRTMVGVLSENIRSGMATRSDRPPGASPTVTARPPSPSTGADEPAPSPARNSAVDLDFDGLLEGFDGETSLYPAEVPRVLRASSPGAAPAAPEPALPPAPPPAAPPAAPADVLDDESSMPTPAIGQMRPAVPAIPRPSLAGGIPRPGAPAAPPKMTPPGAPAKPLIGAKPPVPSPGARLPVPAAPRPPIAPGSPAGGPPSPGRGASALAAAIAAKRAAKATLGAEGDAEARIAAERAEATRVAAERAEADRVARERAAAEKADAEKEAERAALGIRSAPASPVTVDDDLDDVLAALDHDIAPTSTPDVEAAFFREAPKAPAPRATSIADDLADLDDAPAAPSPPAAAPSRDDDEPALAVADDATVDEDDEDGDVVIVAADDDDQEVTFDDDDGPASEEVLLADEDDDEPPTSVAARPSAPAPARTDSPVAGPPSSQTDRGALAARQSVRSRKPRKEHFPLVGRTSAHRTARAELLEQLANGATGAKAARLLVAAAELRRGTDTEAQIDGLLERALAAAPTDPSALRLARARALARSDRGRLVALFQAEANGTSRLALTSEIALHELGGADATKLRAAVDRFDGKRHGASVILPLLAAAPAPSADRERSMIAAAAATRDEGLAQALRRVAAASAAHRGEHTSLAVIASTLGVDGAAMRARAAIAEVARGGAKVMSHGAELGQALGGNAAGEAARRLAAIAALEHDRPTDALELVRGATGPHTTTVWARAAAAAGEGDEELTALDAVAQTAGATGRASALARIAEIRIGRGELDLAEEALRAASLADSELAAPRVVRAQLSRLDPARAARTAAAPELGSVLAAKAAFVDLGQERRALAIAEREDDSPLVADVVGLDVAAELNVAPHHGVEPLLIGLRRHAERIPLDARTGALLALSIEARAGGRDDEAAAAMEQARAGQPGSELVASELSRDLSPSEAAAALLSASHAAQSPRRSSTLALRGARLLEHLVNELQQRSAENEGGEGEGARAYGEGALELLSAARRAVDADATNDVAWLTLSRAAKHAGDAAALADAEARLGELSSSPEEAALHFTRAALARAADDGAAAGELLSRAREQAPDDLVLFALSMRLGEGLGDPERASRLEASLSDAPASLRPALLLAAAAAHDGLGQHDVAARLLGDGPTDGEAVGTERARRRALIAAGKKSIVVDRLSASGQTGSTTARVAALEAVAALEEDAGDPASARRAHEAIRDLVPGHLPTLRWLERNAMSPGEGSADARRDALLAVERALAGTATDPGDAMGHLRLAVRLHGARPDATGDGTDALVLAIEQQVRGDLWLARRVVAASQATGNAGRTLAAERDLFARVSRPLERASLALRAAETAERAGASPEERIAILAAPAEQALEQPVLHPVIYAELAKLVDRLGDPGKIVEAWQRAAEASLVPATRASSFHRAAVVAEDELGDEERALGLYEQAAEADVTHADVFGRAQRILERRGDSERLNALLAKRLSAGGDAAGLVELHMAQAKLNETRGDREAARGALRAALELAPEHPGALKRLAELSLAVADHRAAADALIRLARVRKDREELRWAFFELGDIYDVHIPDPKRAEAAWKRVLKLAPDDVPSMERLAKLYLREGPPASAVAQLEELIRAEPDVDRARDHQLSLARVLEDSGDARRAEQVLESARRTAPTELSTLKAMADLYTRQRAQPALAMHLNRAVNDFRHALASDVADTAAWIGLVEVLNWRRRPDAARVAASAGTAMGIVDVELAKQVDESGAAPGVPTTLGDEAIEDALAPAALTAPLRAVFRALGSSLERVSPFDPRTLRAEKLGPRDSVLRPMVQEVARALGMPPQEEIEIWVAAGAPRACLPVQSTPPVLVVGRDLLTQTDERERRFLIARALKIARAQLALAVRTPPTELALLFAGLVLNADPNYQHGLDNAQAQEWARRVARAVPRRTLEDNGPLLFEMAGAPEHDPSRLPLAVAELGSRAALLATGGVPQALSALAKMVVEGGLPPDPSARAGVLRDVPEAASLIAFAISDAHFEVRTRAGADRL